MFLHGGFWHIFFNMLMLWMFGMELEYTWGSAKFLVYCVLGGIGAGMANLLVAPLLGQVAPTVGASGAVLGILIAFGMLWPDGRSTSTSSSRSAEYIAAAIGIELVTGITGSTDGVAHVAHLGGAAMGFIFIFAERHSEGFRNLMGNLGSGVFRRASRARPRAWTGSEVRDARFYDIGGPPRRDEDGEVTQEVVDAILDKISKGGYQSLSDDEKRILNEASRKIH